MVQKQGKVRRIVVEPSDNGGFITSTERERLPNEMKAGFCYIGDRDGKNTHSNVEELTAYIRKVCGGKAKPKKKPAKGGGTSDLAREMLSER